MNRLILPLTLLALLLTPLSQTIAQMDDAGWPVIERCVGEPTAPPEGWAFEGTILLKGNDAIRGLRADFDTTYIIIFRDNFFDGAAPSPDGRWYAVPSGYTEYATLIDEWYHVEEILVYSTDGKRDMYRIPWELSWNTGVGWVEPLVWLDNQHLVYERSENVFETPKTWIFNPFTGEEETWNKNLNHINRAGIGPISPINSVPSPDLTRTIFNNWQPGTLQDDLRLYNFDTGEPIVSLPFDSNTYPSLWAPNSKLVWKSDSSSFAAWADSVTQKTDDASRYLTLFDRDGNIVDIVTSAPDDVGLSVTYWPDNNRLLFSENSHWYTADVQNRIIVDMCLEPAGIPVWSSDGIQAAFKYQDNVVILNFETDQFYIVGKYEGRVVGWRED